MRSTTTNIEHPDIINLTHDRITLGWKYNTHPRTNVTETILWADFLNSGEGVLNTSSNASMEMPSRSFYGRRFRCVCPPGLGETRLGNSSQGVCHLITQCDILHTGPLVRKKPYEYVQESQPCIPGKTSFRERFDRSLLEVSTRRTGHDFMYSR